MSINGSPTIHPVPNLRPQLLPASSFLTATAIQSLLRHSNSPPLTRKFMPNLNSCPFGNPFRFLSIGAPFASTLPSAWIASEHPCASVRSTCQYPLKTQGSSDAVNSSLRFHGSIALRFQGSKETWIIADAAGWNMRGPQRGIAWEGSRWK